MNRRRTALLLSFIGLLFFVLMSADDNPSSVYSPAPHGLRAFMLLLEGLGRPVQPFLQPFTELEAAGVSGTLFVIQPQSFGAEDALLRWVAEGNRVVVVPAQRHARPLLGIDLTSFTKTDWDEIVTDDIASAIPAGCSLPECEGVQRISPFSRYLRADPAGFDVIVRSGGERSPVVIRKTHGAGDIWIVMDPRGLTNARIDQADNLRFWYQLATHGKTVLFDEFHHGFTLPASGEAAHRERALFVLIGALCAAALVLAASRAVRFGPPLVEPERNSAANVELAVALGLLYREHRIGGALASYVDAWRVRVESVHGLSRRLDDERMLAELAERGIVDGGEREVLAVAIRSLRAGRMREARLDIDNLERIVSPDYS